jgi:apolipoprotein N-acyltransferase
MRALETGRYVLRATNTGITAVIDAKGEVLARSPQFKIHTLVADIWIYDGWTLYARMGNTPVIVAFFLMLGLAAWLGRRSSAR